MSSAPINVEDYRQLAQRRLPRAVFDYLEGGAEDEYGLRHNRDALRTLHFRPRRLVDVDRRELATPLFGRTLPVPLVVGPTGFNALFWPNGDLALARAAARHGIPFVLSTASNASVETVASGCDGELWFQLYIVHRTLAESLVRRAASAGCTALVLTVDVPVNGLRERDRRNGFRLPMRYSPALLLDGLRHPRWSWQYLRHGMPRLAHFDGIEAEDPAIRAALLSRRMDASFAWADLAWLRDLWPHRLLVKGLLHPGDVARCAAHGVDGVILSNHGGRQLDACVAPIQALPEAVAASPLPVLVDSGFRRGADVVKAMALGAGAVLLGRAMLYGLAAAGEAGATDVIAMLKDEIDSTLAQVGCPTVAGLSSDILQPCGPSATGSGDSAVSPMLSGQPDTAVVLAPQTAPALRPAHA